MTSKLTKQEIEQAFQLLSLNTQEQREPYLDLSEMEQDIEETVFIISTTETKDKELKENARLE
jgi:hypothetical protein